MTLKQIAMAASLLIAAIAAESTYAQSTAIQRYKQGIQSRSASLAQSVENAARSIREVRGRPGGAAARAFELFPAIRRTTTEFGDLLQMLKTFNKYLEGLKKPISLQPARQESNVAPGNAYKIGTSIPLPSEKEAHPPGYHAAWVNELSRMEKLLAAPQTSQRIITMENWNRFICYFKMIPDEPHQILSMFMEAYHDDKHYFCAEYAEWIPKLTKGEYSYCLDHYAMEKAVMDEIVRLVFESYDKELVSQLQEIQESDQSLRSKITDQTSAEERTRLLDEQRKIDEGNIETIEEIIAIHGYPGRSLVGIQNEETAFLVIQHSGNAAISKYLPIIESAIAKQELNPRVYPYLFDRLEVSEGRPQHFGTQRKLDSNELFPLHDADNVNQRRQKYGLPPISIN